MLSTSLSHIAGPKGTSRVHFEPLMVIYLSPFVPTLAAAPPPFIPVSGKSEQAQLEFFKSQGIMGPVVFRYHVKMVQGSGEGSGQQSTLTSGHQA